MKETLIEILLFLLERERITAGPGAIAHRAQNLAERLEAQVAEARAEEDAAEAKKEPAA